MGGLVGVASDLDLGECEGSLVCDGGQQMSTGLFEPGRSAQVLAVDRDRVPLRAAWYLPAHRVRVMVPLSQPGADGRVQRVAVEALQHPADR